MELQGKTILFLGDSITEGHVAENLYGFPRIMEEKYGIQAGIYGLHDTRIARQQTPSPYPQWDLDFYIRSQDMPPFAHAVVVFGGTNDYGTGDAPLGKLGDATRDTFYGALQVLLAELKQRYPQAVIAVLTPLPRITEEQPETGKTLLSYVQAVRQVAAANGLPMLDLYTQSGLDPADAITMPDGLHPSDAGHEKLARQLGDFLLNL